MRKKLNDINLSSYIESCASLKASIYKHVLGLPPTRGKCNARYWWHKKNEKPKYVNRKNTKKVDQDILSDYYLQKLKDTLKARSNKDSVYSLVEFSKMIYQRTLLYLVSRKFQFPFKI